MSITIIPAYRHPLEIGRLFSEYTETLAASSPSFQEYLALQDYQNELIHLESKYGMPEGRLYLAFRDGAPAGCVGTGGGSWTSGTAR